MGWVDSQETKQKEERSKEYFNINEGENKFVLLSHCAPLVQVWTGSKYVPAQEGDKNTNIKGLCWVLQDGVIKSAKLPYTVVKSIRALQQNPEWDFSGFPFPHTLTLTAKNAGTKEVEYELMPSPKKVEIPEEVLTELKKKKSPEEIVELIKEKASSSNTLVSRAKVAEDIDPESVPF